GARSGEQEARTEEQVTDQSTAAAPYAISGSARRRKVERSRDIEPFAARAWLTAGPCDVRLRLGGSMWLMLVQVHCVSEIRVPLEKRDLTDVGRVWTGIAQDEEPVADIDDVDEPVLDDRVAPHHDLGLEIGIIDVGVEELVHRLRGAGAERRVLVGHDRYRRWPEEPALTRVSGIGDVDHLKPVRVPVDQREVWKHGRVVRRETSRKL